MPAKISAPVLKHHNLQGLLEPSERNSQMSHELRERQHIFFVTGPAGCGKSTIAEYISHELDMPYIEGDSVSAFPSFVLLSVRPADLTRR